MHSHAARSSEILLDIMNGGHRLSLFLFLKPGLNEDAKTEKMEIMDALVKYEGRHGMLSAIRQQVVGRLMGREQTFKEGFKKLAMASSSTFTHY